MGWMRKMFGPSQNEVWKNLCEELGSEFVDGGFWKGSKVQVNVGEWTITLDTYTVSTGKSSVTYTRMRAPYVNADGFRFTVYRENFFSGIGKWLGMQDVIVGFPEFDREFIIKGNDENKLRALFAHPRIREMIRAQPQIHFEVKDDEGWFGTRFPDGVDELWFSVVGVVKDVERLKTLFSLFAHTLNHLCQIGSAYEDDPRLDLA